MSSETAAYFPQAFGSAVEACEGSQPEPDLIGPLLRGAQPHSSPIEIPFLAPSLVPEASDEMLLVQAGNGAKEALAILFRRHARAVRNTAYRIL
jgi:RNA polymerase sigma-70 factor (ECF subfamily)